ncbi:MAG: hypothetical protein M3R03_10545 [Pseudomonadota bacterium]|nr:hypothetical protein [Pseudomonadota bacterium]
MFASGTALCVMLGACTEQAPTRIDGSSAEAFARTTKAARQDLPVAQRLDFDRAIATVPARRYADRDPAAAERVAFDGLTAGQVLEIERERSGR